MARKSVLIRNENRRKLIDRYAARRTELRKILKDANASNEDKMKAQEDMQKLPRDSCAVRYRNRCKITGRPRGVYRRFGISRSVLRELVLNGDVPGVTKSSW